MKKFNGTNTILILIMGIFLISCEKFVDINSNENALTEPNAAMISASVIEDVFGFRGRDANAMISGNALSKYMGYAGSSAMETQYNSLDPASFTIMTNLPNIDAMLIGAEEAAGINSYKGLAKFARAFIFYTLTMEMGDIPYSEAGQSADGLLTPKYDLQKDVFEGILKELEDADEFFGNGYTFAGDITPYEGSPDKWRRAVNAYRLRTLMSLSEKTSVAELDVINRFNEIVTTGNLMTNETGYFGLEYTSQDRHPMSSTSGVSRTRAVVSDIMIDALKLLNDRRLYYIAEPADALISGGLTQSDPDAYIGVDISIPFNDLLDGYTSGQFSVINDRYEEEVATEPRRVITFAEQQLILAEATIRGWINTGKTAQQYYEEGVSAALTDFTDVTESYAHDMVIDQAYIDAYFNGEAAFKTTDQERLEQIWLQRYILNFMQFTKVSFLENRRHHFPEFPINPSTSLNTDNPNMIPIRWMYPQTEISLNRENYEEAIQRQYNGVDEINEVMWLLQ